MEALSSSIRMVAYTLMNTEVYAVGQLQASHSER